MLKLQQKNLEMTSLISKDYKHILFMDTNDKNFVSTYHTFREASKNCHEKVSKFCLQNISIS